MEVFDFFLRHFISSEVMVAIKVYFPPVFHYLKFTEVLRVLRGLI